MEIPTPTTKKQLIGKRAFEISNHLGNVMAVINDRKTVVAQNNGMATVYDPTFLSAATIATIPGAIVAHGYGV